MYREIPFRGLLNGEMDFQSREKEFRGTRGREKEFRGTG